VVLVVDLLINYALWVLAVSVIYRKASLRIGRLFA